MLTDESILGVPATEPLVPVVAPVVELLVLQGRVPGWVTTGDPPMFGTLGRAAAFGLPGLTAPGIPDCVRGRLAVPVLMPGICFIAPGFDRPGDGFAGETPGGADPGDSDGAVAVPVGLPPIPDETPDDDPDEPVDDVPDEPVPCPYAETLTSAANPAARMSFCDIALSLRGHPSTSRQRVGCPPVPEKALQRFAVC